MKDWVKGYFEKHLNQNLELIRGDLDEIPGFLALAGLGWDGRMVILHARVRKDAWKILLPRLKEFGEAVQAVALDHAPDPIVELLQSAGYAVFTMGGDGKLHYTEGGKEDG